LFSRFVGTVANKKGLVHWREGFPGVGGDACPSLFAFLQGLRARVKKRGAWQGNDTIWRMTADLYNLLHEHGPQRRFSIVDVIRGGEGNGPFCPRTKRSQALIAGADFLAVDCVATRLMGFDCAQVPYLQRLLHEHKRDVRAIALLREQAAAADSLWDNGQRHLDFVPPDGWAAALLNVLACVAFIPGSGLIAAAWATAAAHACLAVGAWLSGRRIWPLPRSWGRWGALFACHSLVTACAFQFDAQLSAWPARVAAKAALLIVSAIVCARCSNVSLLRLSDARRTTRD
jgi:hypothetical protein